MQFARVRAGVLDCAEASQPRQMGRLHLLSTITVLVYLVEAAMRHPEHISPDSLALPVPLGKHAAQLSYLGWPIGAAAQQCDFAIAKLVPRGSVVPASRKCGWLTGVCQFRVLRGFLLSTVPVCGPGLTGLLWTVHGCQDFMRWEEYA